MDKLRIYTEKKKKEYTLEDKNKTNGYEEKGIIIIIIIRVSLCRPDWP